MPTLVIAPISAGGFSPRKRGKSSRKGSIWPSGTAVIAFYRLGPQPVPTLTLLYRAAVGAPPDTLLHMPVSIEITREVYLEHGDLSF